MENKICMNSDLTSLVSDISYYYCRGSNHKNDDYDDDTDLKNVIVYGDSSSCAHFLLPSGSALRVAASLLLSIPPLFCVHLPSSSLISLLGGDGGKRIGVRKTLKAGGLVKENDKLFCSIWSCGWLEEIKAKTCLAKHSDFNQQTVSASFSSGC